MVKCSMKNCSSNSTEFSLFSFPCNPEVREIWINFLKSSGKKVFENVQYRICELHFVSSDFTNSSVKRRLKTGTVPTIFDPTTVSLIKVFLHSLFLLIIQFRNFRKKTFIELPLMKLRKKKRLMGQASI